MTTTDSPTIPPCIIKIAGLEVAERVQAARAAAIELYRQVEAFANGEHGRALHDYWAAHDDLEIGNTIDEFMTFDRVSPILMAIGVPLRSISDFIAEGVGDGLTDTESTISASASGEAFASPDDRSRRTVAWSTPAAAAMAEMLPRGDISAGASNVASVATGGTSVPPAPVAVPARGIHGSPHPSGGEA